MSLDVTTSAEDGERRPRDPFTERGRGLAVELGLGAAVAAAVSLGAQWLVGKLNIPAPSYAPLALVVLGSAILLCGAMWLVTSARWPRWASPVSWSGISGLGTLPLALLLQGTPFYLFGIDQDQLFRTQYLTRLTESMALADGNYADMPPFYPAGWFWVGGRFADLLGMPGWAAYKPWAILTMAVAPVIAFVLWSRIVRRPAALLLSVLTCIVGVRIAAFEPYSWLLAAPMVPLAVLAWRQFQGRAAGRRRHKGPVVLCGVFLGVCGAVYTLHFGFFAFVLVILVAAAVFQRWRRGPNGGRALLARARGVLADLIAIGLIAAPIMLLVWAPFLLRVLELGKLPSGAAPQFLPEFGATVPTPMFESSAVGVVCMAGTIWVILAWRRSEIARGLGILALCCYGWYLLSFLALGAQTTLLAFRIEPVLHVTLFCSGAFAGGQLVRWIASRRFPSRTVPVGVVFAVVTVLGMVSLIQTVPEAEKEANQIPVFERAATEYTPEGVTGRGEADPADKGSYNDELLASIDSMTARPPEDLVVLSTYFDILAFRPYWSFQTITVHYANPLANFDHRREVIESWAKSSSSAELVHKLEQSQYRPPEVFVFRNEPDGLHMQVSRGAFPHKRNVRTHDVVFESSLFDGQHFERRDVGPFTVVVRK